MTTAAEKELLQLAVARQQKALKQRAPKVVTPAAAPTPGAADEELRQHEEALRDDVKKEEATAQAEPGQLIPGEGVYVGKYTPVDRDGNSLSETFNAFAAPEDLPKTMEYIDAVKAVAELKDWNGHDGTNYENDTGLYEALKDGSYTGGWIIPPRELLTGTKADGPSGVRQGTIMQPDNLFDHRNTGSFKNTFETAARSGSGGPQWYWSSSEHRGEPSYVWIANFSCGYDDWDHKGINRMSCRPVRLVAVKP